MNGLPLCIPVRLDAPTFRHFAVYDTFWRSGRALTLGGFAVLMAVFAAMCFIARVYAAGVIILASGLLLPLAQVWSFHRALRGQIEQFGLDSPQSVYTLTLTDTEDGIHVENARGEQAVYEWRHCFGLRRGRDCTYLYVQKNRAFLLPDDCCDRQVLASLAERMLPPHAVHGKRDKKERKTICK